MQDLQTSKMSFEPYYSLETKKLRINPYYLQKGTELSLKSAERPEGHYRDSLWRSGLDLASVGVLYLVSGQRPVNWNYSSSNRYDGVEAFHPSLGRAKAQVEEKRVRGTSWTIAEVPCLVAANEYGSIALVQINSRAPLDGWAIDYSRKSSLGAVGDLWSEYAWSRKDTYLFIQTPNFECGCGKYRQRRFVGFICERCSVEISGTPTNRKGYSTPSLEPLVKLPFREWMSSPAGQGKPLAWRIRPFTGPHQDLGPLFTHAGTLNTHLQNHYASQALSKALGKGRRG